MKSSKKTVFWEKHIEQWQQSGLPQSDYCGLNNLSKSSFSKWKNKLHAQLKGKQKRYEPKSQYAKFTNLSDETFETLMSAFLAGLSVQETAKKANVSIKTVRKINEELQAAVVDGALHFPHLFFHVGTLLLLAPPPDCEERLACYREIFPNRRNKYRSEETREGRLRNNIEFTFQLLMSYTFYEWALEEAFIFRKLGLEVYYKLFYAPPHDMDSDIWNEELYLLMAKEVNLVTAVVANMNYWAVERNKTSYLEEENWQTIFANRRERKFDGKWHKQMLHDLKWVLQKQRIGDVKKQRNTYWDEFSPDPKSLEAAKKKLQNN